MKWLFIKSKWIHKYLGLPLILFLVWMSISGILLNHPELISGISVPSRLVPNQYRVKNWNRSSLITLIYSQQNPEIAFAAGKLGVWKTTDGGRSFVHMRNGFPASDFYAKTNSLYLREENRRQLFAGTDGGLFVCDLATGQWKKVPLGPERERVLKILRVKNELVVFTPSHAYRANLSSGELNFRQIPLLRQNPENRVSFVRLFFDLHDGSAWGLAGRLIFDFAGLLIIFLSVSAFYNWFYPWKRRRANPRVQRKGRKLRQGFFKYFYRYHLKFGIWSAVILLLIGATGIFMRPPLLAVIANGDIPAKWYPGKLPENPWDEKIHNALYDPVEDRVIIETTEGFWSGAADFASPFVKTEFPAPVFVMGTTVFKPYGSGGFLVGSFNGIFHLERSTAEVVDLLSGKKVSRAVSNVRPAETMVTGYFRTPAGEEFITAHRKGLIPLNGAKTNGRFAMPREMHTNYRMPLWNFMFELHNARIFKDLIGGLYILVVPLGAILFCLIILSGIYDWLYLKIRRSKRKAIL